MSTNNSADIVLKRIISQQKKEDDYPDPYKLPLPSQGPRIATEEVTLSELVPGRYVSTTARVVYLRTIERQDALGNKVIFSGILEDSTFKVSFVSHRISYPLIRNCVYKFQSTYVHEFPSDKSLLLVITEHTKIDPKDIEDYKEFIWKPKIDSIKRPVRSLTLQGVITTVHGNSGLVKRCNKCRSILLVDDSCPNKCPEKEGWGWDLRVSCRLYDGSGSLKMVLTKDIASKVLQRNLADLILLASSSKIKPSNISSKSQPPPTPSSEITLKIPDNIDVIEAVTEENVSSSSYRSSDKIIVTDGRNLVYFSPNEEDERKFSEYVKRPLKISDIEDRKIIKRLIEKALDIGIRKVTGMRKMQGIYLLEEPISLYRCGRAKLYLGFSIQVTIKEIEDKYNNAAATATVAKTSRTTTVAAVIETTPQSYVRESVLDYVRLRRNRGASANSVISNLTKYRNKVIVAPSGNYGCIVDVIARKAGSQLVSDTDKRNLVDFWKQIYGIDISPDEIPLLKVKMINSENVFTYPPSMCFFGNDSLFIPADVQKFVEYKKSTVKPRMDKVVNSLVNEEESLRIGDTKLEFEGCISTAANTNNTDIQVQLLHEVRQKLFGRSVMARGSAMFVHDEIWFFPNQLRVS